ncbi:5'/3'-nucleotidase SurE [Cryomorphaceae bacterium 1068]|nr:5'/3'-nucleotidase SurE [Cryomorphaceae bacterium 1068]
MSEKKERPLILVTNDDGITAGGIRSLIEVAQEFGDVWVVAPDSPQSGMGHAITVHDILRLEEVSDVEGVTEFSCTGTPVDCVKLAIYRVLKRKPDLLLSGINHGANYSINVIYSGTMSAAVEGAVEGIPSIGFSLLDHSAEADFTASKEVVRKVVKNALEKGVPKNTCLNVNIPNVSIEEIKGIRVCRQAKASWEDDFEPRKDPSGKIYYWITGKFVNPDKGDDTDVWALDHNYVSVVPVQFDLTAHHAMAELNEWDYDA